MDRKTIFLDRKSARAFTDEEISEDLRREILEMTYRAPTAGNMMLYSLLDITDQSLKDKLAETCDHQPFIARAPWVVVFLADWQRWYDAFERAGFREYSGKEEIRVRTPEEGELFLACSDALIAAQTFVTALESYGIGSCYIGDIMEQYETHKELFNLPRWAFPIAMVVAGYPTDQQKERKQPPRIKDKFVRFENQYQSMGDSEAIWGKHVEKTNQKSADRFVLAMYKRKVSGDFSVEMSRSVRAAMARWLKD